MNSFIKCDVTFREKNVDLNTLKYISFHSCLHLNMNLEDYTCYRKLMWHTLLVLHANCKNCLYL